ncbi:MAG TPA: universal stress protein [Ktedonobacteraceae bacterium]|nr:universal stress protein [Ktedonobacteraceae bacterium]
MFKRIIVPLDGSQRAEQAIPFAARIARELASTVQLVHVIDATTIFLSTRIIQPSLKQSMLDTHQDNATKYLEQVAQSAQLEGIPTKITVLFGSAASAIISIADNSDLIVLCSHGYTGVTRLVLGSVAEYVIRHGSTPILLLREGAIPVQELSTNQHAAARILVTLDGSIAAKAALAPAIALASALSAPQPVKLHLLRVVKAEVPESEDQLLRLTGRPQRYLQMIAEHLDEEVAIPQTASSALSMRYSTLVSPDVVGAIVNAAEHGLGGEASGYDVLAIATRGQTGLKKLALGSVTSGVIDQINMPVLVVPPASETDQRPDVQKIDQQLETKQEVPFLRPGAAYPKDYVIAAIDDESEARQAMRELEDAGIAAENIHFFTSRQVLESAEDTAVTRSPLSRLADVFQAVASDDDAHVLIYVEEARRGRNIINVLAENSEQVQTISDILVKHHAHNIKYFGRWAVTVLHP